MFIKFINPLINLIYLSLFFTDCFFIFAVITLKKEIKLYMKRIVFIFALLATTLVAWAQETEETVIELMNGSIIRGELIDVGDGQRLYIKTANGSIIYFTNRAVKEIGSQTALPTLRNFINPVTVYLRNGSIITGQLTELQEGGEMKIETPNRSIVYFTERTLKEVVSGDRPAPRQRTAVPEQQTAPPERRTAPRTQTAPRNPYAVQKETQDDRLLVDAPLPTTSGYKGFFDAGYTMKMGDLSSSRIEVSTSHGYQINPSLFVGLGFGANLYSDGFYKNSIYTNDSIGGPKDVMMKKADSLNISATLPIFVDIRYNFIPEGQIIPFAGLKAGYSMGLAKTELYEESDAEKRMKTETKVASVGFYVSPSIGAKYVVSPTFALNLSLGYTMQMFDLSYRDTKNGVTNTYKKNNGGISIKIGLEF
jgi:small nuclear ribonucleoprotein (snRNP)-like protein